MRPGLALKGPAYLSMKAGSIVRGFSAYLTVGALVMVLVMGITLPGHTQGAHFSNVWIEVTPTPRWVPADGQTRARVRVDLREATGAPLPDGVVVVVHIDLGRLSTTGAYWDTTLQLESRSGFVSFWAVSDTPGTARLTITVQGSRPRRSTLDFLPPGETGLVETRIVRIGGGWTGYAVDFNLVEAREEAWAHFGRLRLEGVDLLQLEVDRMILRAGGVPVTLTNGERELQGRDFYLELHAKRGLLRRFGEEGIEYVTFDLYTLEPREMDWEIPDRPFMRERRSSATLIKAREISVFSDEKIVFRHGALYTEQDKVMSLWPTWILALPGYTGASNTQVLGLSSSGGVAVKLPYFLSVGKVSTNAVQIEKGTQASSVVARDDWSLGLAHEYRVGSVSGAVEVRGLPHDDWGMEWRDSRSLRRGSRVDLDLGWPDHRSLFFAGNLYDYRQSHSFSLRTFYQKPRLIPESYGASAEWLTDPRPVSSGKHMYYRLGTSLGVEKGGLMDSPHPQFVNELYGSLDWRPWRLGERTSLRPSFTNVFTWDTSPYQANSLRSELRLDHSFGQPLDLTLRYSAQHLSGDATQTGWQQMLSTNLSAYHGAKWRLYSSANLDLDNGDWYSYLQWDYDLSRRWRLGLLGTWYQYAGTSYNDQEIYLGRRIFQNREIGVLWSRQTSRFSLELIGLTSAF